ncbi:hypothetical protein V6N12_007588 [Hibiscus sabdariffa]|uniref:Endonuclease/exonuclease/phosphatase domain-containing protein n=1 Tax=Hibiscus sabdariffa TaxID=183260 RepID=A0ABR2F279_9ROSI
MKFEKIRRNLKFECSFYVEPVGSAGGLALWWDGETQIQILHADSNVIDTSISLKDGKIWFCSFIYGPSYRERKEAFWEGMRNMRTESDAPWCIMGDSNIILRQEEKIGGNMYDLNQASWLSHFMEDAGLLEMHLQGDMFHRADGFIETSIGSDHYPIICNFYGSFRKRKRDFKFESKWLLEDDCKLVVLEACCNQSRGSDNAGLCRKLKRTKFKLQKWCKEKYESKKNKGTVSKRNSRDPTLSPDKGIKRRSE